MEVAMCFFPTHRQVRQSRTRAVLFFFKVIAIVTIGFAAIKAVHYLLGWW
jgi:hypothetical protein